MKKTILFFMILTSMCSINYAGTLTTQDLQNAAAAINKDLPKKVDNVTQFVSVSVDSTAFHFHYQVSTKVAAYNLEKTKNTMKKNLLSHVCNDPTVKKLLNNGTNIAYNYEDKDGYPIINILFTPADCKQ